MDDLLLVGVINGMCDSECTATTTTAVAQTGDILCSDTGLPIAPTGFDSSIPYYLGNFPFTSPYSPMLGDKVILYCNGTASYAVLNSAGCVVAEGAIVGGFCGVCGTIDVSSLMPEPCFTESCLSFQIRIHPTTPGVQCL